MAEFEIIKERVILWLVMPWSLPAPFNLGTIEEFGQFCDEANEFYNTHIKTPVPLIYLKEFYNDTE